MTCRPCARGDVKPGEGGEAFDLPEDFWDDAEITPPQIKRPVSLRVDPDIIDFFKAQGSGHLTRMHAVLRSCLDAQRKRSDQ